MRATFPHMGNNWLAFKGLLEALDIDVLVPPKTSEQTLRLGKRHSPEFICYPFKVNMGNFLEAVDLGADTIFMAGGSGKCRFGFYSHVQQRILRDLGYDCRFVVLNQYTICDTLFSLLPRLTQKPVSEVIRAFLLFLHKAKVLSVVEQRARYLRPRATQLAHVDEAVERALVQLDQAQTSTSVREVEVDLDDLFSGVTTHEAQPLKIELLGEIYIISDSFSNHYLERMLGQMGVEVHNSSSLYHWLKFLLRIEPGRLGSYIRGFRYLRAGVGGEAFHTIGQAVKCSKNGHQGIIVAYPFTCMPENIARGFLPAISKKYGMPILTLSFDEQTSETGLRTRIEAFIDLARWRWKRTRLSTGQPSGQRSRRA